MPPTRPRIIAEDARSETSSVVTSLKDRVNMTSGAPKGKRALAQAVNGLHTGSKVNALNNILATAVEAATTTTNVDAETPHVRFLEGFPTFTNSLIASLLLRREVANW